MGSAHTPRGHPLDLLRHASRLDPLEHGPDSAGCLRRAEREKTAIVLSWRAGPRGGCGSAGVEEGHLDPDRLDRISLPQVAAKPIGNMSD